VGLKAAEERRESESGRLVVPVNRLVLREIAAKAIRARVEFLTVH
jgi:hypothetical protein